MAIERSFRGITVRLAVRYLRHLGGELVERAGDLSEPGATATVSGDGWWADVDSAPADVGPSLTLTEVTVTFEGERIDGERIEDDGTAADERTLEELVDAFARKAMRAGG